MVIFSPIFAINATRLSSTVLPFFILDFFNSSRLDFVLLLISVISLTNDIKSSFFATKSVSQLTSIKDVQFSSPLKATTPSLASLDIFLDALEIPLTLKISTALSRSPFDSLIARLQSLKPAPVTFLNFLTLSMSLIVS